MIGDLIATYTSEYIPLSRPDRYLSGWERGGAALGGADEQD